MADWLRSQVEWLHQFSEQNLTEDVTLLQGGQEFGPIPMTVAGENNEKISDFGSVVINSRRQDFLVTPDELIAAGAGEIVRGDIIRREVNGMQIDYEVAPDDSESATRWMSRYRGRLRVHTNRVGVEEIPQP